LRLKLAKNNNVYSLLKKVTHKEREEEMACCVQQFIVGTFLLVTCALLAVWTVLLNDFDKLVADTPPPGEYRSTRDFVLAAALLLGNIVFMSFVKMVTRAKATQGPLYAGLLASQVWVAAAFVHIAYWEAWANDALYAPFYGRLTFNIMSGLRLQLTCLVLSWANAGFVCAVAFDHRIGLDKTADAATRSAIREDFDDDSHVVSAAALRRRGRSPCSAKRAAALGRSPLVDLSEAEATGNDLEEAGQQHGGGGGWYLAAPTGSYTATHAGAAPHFYVPAGPSFARERRDLY
jgi:hypothetical protein